MVYVFPDSICGKLLGVERHRYINTAEPMPYETCTRLEDLFEKMLPTDMQGDGVNYLIRTRSDVYKRQTLQRKIWISLHGKGFI